MNEVKFAHLTITSQGMEKAVNLVLSNAQSKKSEKKAFHLVNSYTCQIFATMKQGNPLIEANSVNFPDGYWISKYLKNKSKSIEFSQIRGPGLFRQVLANEESARMRHLFLGSTEETLKSLINVVSKSVNIGCKPENLFYISPPYRPMKESEISGISDFVIKNEIDIIWVGMGTPKQDYLANDLTVRSRTTTVAVGAAFDFLSGSKPEAPTWMGKIGLEWLFRLATEPKRLWKRYIFGNAYFLWLILKDLKKP